MQGGEFIWSWTIPILLSLMNSEWQAADVLVSNYLHGSREDHKCPEQSGEQQDNTYICQYITFITFYIHLFMHSCEIDHILNSYYHH